MRAEANGLVLCVEKSQPLISLRAERKRKRKAISGAESNLERMQRHIADYIAAVQEKGKRKVQLVKDKTTEVSCNHAREKSQIHGEKNRLRERAPITLSAGHVFWIAASPRLFALVLVEMKKSETNKPRNQKYNAI